MLIALLVLVLVAVGMATVLWKHQQGQQEAASGFHRQPAEPGTSSPQATTSRATRFGCPKVPVEALGSLPLPDGVYCDLEKVLADRCSTGGTGLLAPGRQIVDAGRVLRSMGDGNSVETANPTGVHVTLTCPIRGGIGFPASIRLSSQDLVAIETDPCQNLSLDSMPDIVDIANSTGKVPEAINFGCSGGAYNGADSPNGIDVDLLASDLSARFENGGTLMPSADCGRPPPAERPVGVEFRCRVEDSESAATAVSVVTDSGPFYRFLRFQDQQNKVGD